MTIEHVRRLSAFGAVIRVWITNVDTDQADAIASTVRREFVQNGNVSSFLLESVARQLISYDSRISKVEIILDSGCGIVATR